MPVVPLHRPYPFNQDLVNSSGEFSRLDALLIDAVNEIGEKNAAVVISKYSNHLINAANKVIDDVNRHPYFLQMLEYAFDDGVASVTADSNKITIVSGFSSVDPYTPLRLKAVGYGTTPGDVITFTMDKWVSGQTTLRIADYPHLTKADCVVTMVYKGRISRYTASDDRKDISDRVIIEGIKYYWSADRDVVSRSSNVTKSRAHYFDALNTWLGQLRNVHGILEIDHDQRGHDF